MTTKVRVRIAPSPTGDPHVGFAFTSLFNYVFARKYGGDLIFRVEDTDRNRFKVNSEKHLLSSLEWLGLTWDEGPDKGGPFAPYRQSERLPLYRKHCERLLANGSAYRCFCSPQRLERIRQEQRRRKEIPRYDHHCRELSTQQEGIPHTVRMKMPLAGEIEFHDEIRGQISISSQQLDDQILLKSDGYPTYHLASVVDDYEMQISHVIRAEEWLSSTPKHVVLYEILGFDKPPLFLHLPILRNPDRSKISKRKNPVSLKLFAKLGILPDALINFLALIGGSVDLEQEVFNIDDMVANFSPASLNLGGPVFDMQKLLWLNQKYILNMSANEFVHHLRERIMNTDVLHKMFPLFKSRIDTLAAFFSQAQFFFTAKINRRGLNIVPVTRSEAELHRVMASLVERLEDCDTWTQANIKDHMQAVLKENKWKTKELYMPVRLLTTGTSTSPELIPTLELLGKELVTWRIRDFLATGDIPAKTI